jgi:hypothetical protein
VRLRRAEQAPRSDAARALERAVRAAVCIQRRFRLWRRRRVRARALAANSLAEWCAAGGAPAGGRLSDRCACAAPSAWQPQAA